METRDAFLDGRISVLQPQDGYRAATDPVFLAASVPAKSGETVLDVGCGVGTASLCLNARVAGLRLTGLEIQKDYAALAVSNAENNGAALKIIRTDLSHLPVDIKKQSFDHVMTNPPYFVANALSAPADAGKTMANIETMDLGDWIDLGVRRLKSRGSYTMIHLTERLPQILHHISRSCGDIRVLPIASRHGRAAKRVIVQGVKESKASMKLLPPFVVHDGVRHIADGNDYSQLAQDVLRHAQGITLSTLS